MIISWSSDVKEVHDRLNDAVGLSSLLALWFIEVLVLLPPFSAEVAVSSSEVPSSILQVAQRGKGDLEGIFEVKLLHDCLNFLGYYITYLELDLLMFGDHMLWEELTGLELFIAEHAFPYLLLLVLLELLGLSNELLDLLSEEAHVVWDLASLCDPFLGVLLDLLEDRLNAL